MRIIELIIENFKNIKIAEITPTGGTVIISGENGAGKTAIIDAFWMALDQKGAIKENPDPIRHGETHAKVTVNLGKYIVTRTWTEAKTYLKIENAEGAVFKSPGAMLSSLIGELSFDPQAFSMMSEKEQLGTLINMLDLSIDIPTLDLQRRELYDARTQINREVTALKGQRDGIIIPENVPDEEVSSADVMAEYQRAIDQKAKNTEKRSAYSDAETFLTSIAQNVKEVTVRLDELNKHLDIAYSTKIKLEAEVKALVDPDLESFKCEVNDIEQKNALIRLKQDKQLILTKLSEQQATSRTMSNEIKDIDSQKANAIKEATMPVPGLSFDESGVLYNGTSLKGCSAAEQLRVSVAMAMALNPEIRVIRITDGSLLDSSNMKVIEEMAQEQDFQVWVERVDESGKLGIFIQEGEVVADNQVRPDTSEEPNDADRHGARTGVPQMPAPKN